MSITWAELEPTLTVRQKEVVTWCAIHHKDPRDAVRAKLISGAALDQWRADTTRFWVQVYRESHPTPADIVAGIRSRLTDMAQPACDVLQASLTGTKPNATALKAAQWVVETVLAHCEKITPAGALVVNIEEEELDRTLRLVGTGGD